jgi:hypothetical protein
VVVVVVAATLASGYPNAAFVIALGALLGTGTALYRRWRPLSSPAVEPQGWRVDHNGNWRWWNGFVFTEPPTDEPPDKRNIGPEMEW